MPCSARSEWRLSRKKLKILGVSTWVLESSENLQTDKSKRVKIPISYLPVERRSRIAMRRDVCRP